MEEAREIGSPFLKSENLPFCGVYPSLAWDGCVGKRGNHKEEGCAERQKYEHKKSPFELIHILFRFQSAPDRCAFVVEETSSQR